MQFWAGVHALMVPRPRSRDGAAAHGELPADVVVLAAEDVAAALAATLEEGIEGIAALLLKAR